MRIRKVLLCLFHCKARPSGVSLEPLGLENIFQVPPDRAEVGQSHDARKGALGLSFSLKVNLGYSSGKKLESARSKSVALSLSLEPRPSGVSLESPGLENIPRIPANRAKDAQNQDTSKAVSATLSL